MDRADCVVIGAGVVGLAIARGLAEAGREVLVVEAEDGIGRGISSRNSEVIHAGIYYPAGSLKARFCVAGKEKLYAYCTERGVPHRATGKLIVATTEAERTVLDAIRAKAEANGVGDLKLLDRAEVGRLEPELDVVAGLLSPSTGIVDSHALMLELQGDAEAAGAMFAFHAPVDRGAITTDGVTLQFGGALDGFALAAGLVINAAGLFAHHVAGRIDGVPAAAIPAVTYAKGNYFSLTRRAGFRHLIYPVPEPGGLGVHLTLDLSGGVRFGPDVEPIDSIAYAVDPGRAAPFYAAIRRYWPGLGDGELQPDYAGIRPKTNGLAFADFAIEQAGSGLINLFGIESPGLTSALAIAEHVVALTRSGAA